MRTPRPQRAFFFRALAPFALAWLLAACTGDAPLGGLSTSAVRVRLLSPTTVRSVIVQVTGTGITGEIAANITIDSLGQGTATLPVPAGGARRFRFTALDTFRIATHAADTTLDLAGGTRALAVQLTPLLARVGVSVTPGSPSFFVSMYDDDNIARSVYFGFGGSQPGNLPDGAFWLVAGEALRANFTAALPNIGIYPDSLAIGSSDPSVFTIEGSGYQRTWMAHRAGDAELSVSYGGKGFRVPVRVRAPRSCQEIRTTWPFAPTGRWPIHLAAPGAPPLIARAWCDMATDGGGWTRVLGVQASLSSPWEVPFAAEPAGLVSAGTMAGALTPQATRTLMQRVGATELRWRCEKPAVGRRFHIKTADAAVIAYYTGASDVMPSAPGTFTPLDDDTSILRANPARWGRIGTTYETGTWGHEAIARSDRFILAGPFIKELAHWTLFQQRFECDDYVLSGSRQGTWELFIR